MSDYQQKDMEGVLFKNDKKESDKHPDYQGSMTVNGVKYNLGAWINTGKQSGKKFMSLRVSPWGRQEQKSAPQTKPREAGADDDLGDSVPF